MKKKPTKFEKVKTIQLHNGWRASFFAPVQEEMERGTMVCLNEDGTLSPMDMGKKLGKDFLGVAIRDANADKA